MTAAIPLFLARITAKVLVNIRGKQSQNVEFYSWVWASGTHGGPRLFRTSLGSVHILFLKTESGYLHTVCDYPNCDLPIAAKRSSWFVSEWQNGYGKSVQTMERIVAVRFKSALDGEAADFGDFYFDPSELADLTSPAFVVGQLNQLCHSLPDPAARKAACSEYEQNVRAYR